MLWLWCVCVCLCASLNRLSRPHHVSHFIDSPIRKPISLLKHGIARWWTSQYSHWQSLPVASTSHPMPAVLQWHPACAEQWWHWPVASKPSVRPWPVLCARHGQIWGSKNVEECRAGWNKKKQHTKTSQIINAEENSPLTGSPASSRSHPNLKEGLEALA